MRLSWVVMGALFRIKTTMAQRRKDMIAINGVKN